MFDKNKFLNSDFGRTLRVMIKGWDEALMDKENKISGDTINSYINHCSIYWEAAQAALQYFAGKEYYFSRTEKRCGIMDEDGNYLFRVR